MLVWLASLAVFGVEAYVQIQNLLNRRYIVNPGPYNPPQYGTPFEAFAGLRFAFE